MAKMETAEKRLARNAKEARELERCRKQLEKKKPKGMNL